MIDAQSADGRERLTAVLGVGRWVDEVAAGGPYPTVAALVEAGDRVAATLSDTELDEAIGALAREQSTDDEDASSGDQAGLARNDEGVDAAVARGNEVYRSRFGRAFVIRTAGRSRQEVLDELQRRLKNDDATEEREVKEQLQEITALRIGAVFGEDA